METNDTANTEYKPRDYSLERWIVILLSLLFFLPFVADAQETTTLDKYEGAGLLLKTATPGTYAIVPPLLLLPDGVSGSFAVTDARSGE